MNSITKICSHCKQEINLSDFGNDKWLCLECKRESRRESTKRNKATREAYEATHKEQRKEIQRKWKANNPEKYKASRKNSLGKWIAENRDKVRGYVKKWNDKNRGKVNEYHKVWKAKNPDKVATSRHNTRAQRKGAEGKHTAQEWRELCERYGNKCLCCGEEKPLSVDHVIPLSKGGTNYIDNIQPLCLTCNKRKNTKTIDYRL